MLDFLRLAEQLEGTPVQPPTIFRAAVGECRGDAAAPLLGDKEGPCRSERAAVVGVFEAQRFPKASLEWQPATACRWILPIPVRFPAMKVSVATKSLVRSAFV